MGMVYRDEPRAKFVGSRQRWTFGRMKRRAGSTRAQGLMGLGAEPSDPRELYAKYAEKVGRYRVTLSTISSSNARAVLQKQFLSVLEEQGRIAPAFTEGATPGTKDIDRVKTWSDSVNRFSRALTAAVKLYGTSAIPAAPPMTAPSKPVARTVPIDSGKGVGVAVAVVAVLVVVAIASR